jgi:beta-glucosidase
MARRKRESDTSQEPDERVLGRDPFEDLDMEWMDREEDAPSIEILGHDPFEDLDLTGVTEEEYELFPGFAQEEPVAEHALSVPAPAMLELDHPVIAIEPEPLARFESLELSETKPSADVVPVRPMATFHFPADFKWGVATAAHQVEGNNENNDWWSWEQEGNHIKGEGRSQLACDWWENAEADFDHAAAMGLNALRLSVEWSRIEPRPGEFNVSALARYAQMLRGLRERDIEPMVTLHHFTNPMWLVGRGGWENPETIPLFARFTRRVVEALGQYCDLWCTVNEPNVYGYLGYLEGIFPPGKSDLKTALYVIRNLLAAHAAAYREIHAAQPHARVGLAHNMRIFDPANPRSLLDRRAAQMMDRVYNQAVLTALTQGRWMLPLGFGLALRLRRTLDWIGLNYYTRDLVAFDRTQRQTLFSRRLHAEDAELLDGGYGEFYPQGIFRCIRRLSHLNLPIYVTEHGIPDDDDDQRPRHLLTHLHQMWRAIQFCYPVMGYYHWTLVDNFEWAEGWSLRFGLIALDPKTQARAPRRSANLYAEIARASAIAPQAIDTYAPELRPELLPG